MVKKIFVGTLILIATGFALYFGYHVTAPNKLEAYVPLEIEIEIPEPTMLFNMIVDNDIIIEDKINRNEFLGDILMRHNVAPGIIHQIALLSRNVFDVRKISTNKKYTLICNDDSLRTAKAFVYEPNQIDYVVFSFQDSLRVETHKRDVTIVESSISGMINSNLSQTIEQLGISHELTNKFVDIFAWQVDFQRLQKGDKFKLIYEESQVNGQTVGINKIIGIQFNHFNSDYYAFPFDQGEGLDYFDEDGNSLRKALLKYPIEFTRISSRYTQSRFHPVQKRYKAHLGTDFAAPTGTPIRSVGDGIVLEAQYKSANGNYVKIRHNSTYTTQYLHMSKIAGGVKAGTKVKQGQTIGFVGSTGLATGPHLCYRFWKNGVQVDALRIELPPSQPIHADFLAPYEDVKKAMIDKLNQISYPTETVDAIASLN